MRHIAIFTIILSFMLLCAISGYAGVNCFQEGCAGQSPKINNNTAYADNMNPLLNGVSYTKCLLPGTNFTPVATDFNNDHVPEIVVTTPGDIQIYDQFCSQIGSINKQAYAMPVVANFNGDAYQDIGVLTNNSLEFYSWDISTNNFIMKYNVTYYAIAGSASYDLLTCSRVMDTNDTFHCLAAKYNSRNVLVFNYTTATNTMSVGLRSNLLTNNIYTYRHKTGLANYFKTTTFYVPGSSEALYQYISRTMICPEDISALGTQIRCEVLNMFTGDIVGSTGNLISASTAVSDITFINAVPFPTSNEFFWAVSIQFVKGSSTPQHAYYIISASGNTLMANITTGASMYVNDAASNLMAGDYNHDSQTEVCYVQQNTVNNTMEFRCLDSTFTTFKTVVDVNNTINLSQGFLMGQYNKTHPTMCIADYKGIYCNNTKIYDFGILSMNTLNRTGMTAQYSFSGAHMFAFTDSSATWLLVDSVVSASCGNGVCDTFESSFSCPVDCGLSFNGSCYTDTDCAEPYPVCLGNRCVQGFNNSLTCVQDSDCPYYSPTCWQNFCVESISGGRPTSAQTDYQANITHWVDYLLGSSSFIKMVIGIMLIVAAMAMAFIGAASYNIPAAGALILGIVAGLLMFIFDIAFGLLPIWVFVLFVLSIFGIWLIFSYFMRSGSVSQ